MIQKMQAIKLTHMKLLNRSCYDHNSAI